MDCSKVGQDLPVFSDGSHTEQKQLGKLSAKVKSEMDMSLMGGGGGGGEIGKSTFRASTATTSHAERAAA